MVKLNGSKLQQLRISRDMTQAKLAERSETTERYLRDLESGKKYNLSASLLYRFANVLDVSMEELLEIQEEGE